MPNDADPVATIQALKAVGIDSSVRETDLQQWLTNREFTPYPAVAEALLKLLEGRELRLPVFIDVIVFNYENSPGVPSPRRLEDVRFAILEVAVVDGFNNRHGEHNAGFGSLLKPLDHGGPDHNERASIALQSYNFPDRYVRHANFLGELTPIVSDLDRRDATFAMVPALAIETAGPFLVSFQSLNLPDHFLRHQGLRVRLDKRTDDPVMRDDASFFRFNGFLPLPHEYCQYAEEPYASYADKVPVTDADVVNAAHALLYLVNRERLQAALPALCYQGKLAVAARAHSENWATDPDRRCPPHDPPLGCGHWDSREGFAWPEDRFARSGYEPTATSENTQNGGGRSDGTNVVPAGWTWGTPQAAVYWWMNHDPENNYARNGHRAAILNPNFKDAGPGVGRYVDRFGNRAATFTLMFGAR